MGPVRRQHRLVAGRHVDNAAPDLVRHHVARNRLAGQEVAIQVRSQHRHPLPLGVREVQKGDAAECAGVVDKDVHAAKLFDNRSEHALDVCLIARVRLDRDGAPAVGARRHRCLLRGSGIRPEDDRHVSAIACQAERQRSADTPSTTSDDGSPPRQVDLHHARIRAHITVRLRRVADEPGTRPRRAARVHCSACGRAVGKSHRFCPHCGAPVQRAEDSARMGSGPSLQVSAASQVDLSENRRLVTVLFADLIGSTTLGERLDPEDLRGVLSSYFGTLSREIQRYGGTIDKYIGDAVMAVFGAPVAHEDDAERAISAAIGIQAAVSALNDELERRYGSRLAVRIGLNSGEVVAGMLAGSAGGAYTIVGDTVNTAQRFESAAQPGTILVGELTRDLARRTFDFEAVPPLVLKGKTDPRPAFRVLGPRYESLDPEPTPLIGRDVELRLILGALERAVSGAGGLVHIVGDAGIGKTRLVREFRNTLPEAILQTMGRCVSFEVSRPYALLARLLRDVMRLPAALDVHAAASGIDMVLSGLRATADPFDRDLLLEVIGLSESPGIDPRSRLGALLQLMFRLLEAYTEKTTLLIIAEDLHWADPASAALLAEVASRIPERRCLLLTTARDGWIPPWRPHIVVSLNALSEDGARRLIEVTYGAPVEDQLAETILARAGGNPFFIEQIVAGVRASGELVMRDGRFGVSQGAPLHVPATIQEVITARLDRLPKEPKRVLQVASVIGRVFRRRVVERLVPADQLLADRLATLEREGYVLPHALQPEPTYVFRHALLQEVAYNGQLQSQRKATHAAIGETLEDCFSDRLQDVLSELAFHFGRSDNHPKAVYWLVRAGDHARALYANQEALTQYRAALEHASDGTGEFDLPAILERISDVQLLIGRYEDSIQSIRSAVSHSTTGRGALIARLQRRLGTALLLKGAYDEAAAAFEAAASALTDASHVEAARILLQQGQLHYRRGDFDRAREVLARGVDLSTELGADDLVAEGLKQLGNVALEQGELTTAAEFYQRSRMLYEQLEDMLGIADMRSNMGIVYRRTGRWDEALAEYRSALAIRERIGHQLGIGTVYNNIAEVYRSRGESAQAIPAYQQAIDTWSSIGHALFVGLALVGLGAARIEVGEVEQGRADLLDAAQRFARLGSTIYLPDLYRYLAEAELARGDLDAATRAAGISLEYARQSTARHQEGATLRVQAEIALARNDPSLAQRLLLESQRTLQELGEALELAKTEALLQRTSRGRRRRREYDRDRQIS